MSADKSIFKTKIPISNFRGFTTRHANQILVQPAEGEEYVILRLNNCEGNATTPTAFANFAADVCKLIRERHITSFSMKYWELKSKQSQSSIKTKAEEKADAFQTSLVDRDTRGHKVYLGTVYFDEIDIRSIGLSNGSLKLREGCYWDNNEKDYDIKRLRSALPKYDKELKPYHDFRNMLPVSVQQRDIYKAEVEVSKNIVGSLVGKAGSQVIRIQEECDVIIKSPTSSDSRSIFYIESSTEQHVIDAILELKSLVPAEAYDNQPALFAESRIRKSGGGLPYEEVFMQTKGEISKAVIVGSKSIVSYTVLFPHIAGCGPAIMDVELLGLQVITTRGDNNSWLNKADTFEVVVRSQQYSGSLVSSEVQISPEAMGYSQGNTRRNVHVVMFTANTDKKNININEHILRLGYCKLLQSARYYNPETYRREDPVRSLFPYMSNILMVSCPSKCNGLSWCKAENEMVRAEREAAHAERGVWATKERCSEPLIQERRPSSKRHLFIDNSNIWITGMHFSGERKGCRFHRAASVSEKLQKSGERYSWEDIIVRVYKDNVVRKFVCNRMPYCSSDRSWRLDIDKLLWMIGYDSSLDPNFHVAGSVPPDNEDIWNALRNRGSINVLTNRTNEGNSSSEDTSLVNKIFERLDHMSENDDFILCAGDRGFRQTLISVRNRFPRMRIFIVAWAHAAYHRLKDMNDENTFFINLDPYIDFLCYSSESLRELTSAPTEADEQGRLAMCDASREKEILDFLKSPPLHLIKDRDFKLSWNKKQGYVYVIFTTAQKNNGVVLQCKTKFGKCAASRRKTAGENLFQFHRTRTAGRFSSNSQPNKFSCLEESDDDDVDSEDEDYVYDDDCDIIDCED